jgi:ABC-2 type transport system permease protein
MTILRTLLWRALRTERTYRFFLLSRLALPLLALSVTLFMDRLVGAAPALAGYGGSYLPFVLLGLLAADLQGAVTTAAVSALRTEQLQGTLEPLLAAAPAPLGRVLLGVGAYELAWAGGQALLFAAALAAVARARGLAADLGGVLATATLFLVFAAGLWLLSSAAALVYKRANPVAAVLSVATYVAAGTLYPVGVLPGWLERLAWLLPTTHFIEALRRAALTGASPGTLGRTLVFCAIFAAASLAAGVLAFRAAVARGLRGGWLADY